MISQRDVLRQVARRAPPRPDRHPPPVRRLIGATQIELTVDRDSVLVGHELAEIPLPGGAVVTIIHRAGAVVIPRGPVVLEADDQLTILAEPAAEAAVRRLLSEVGQTSQIPGSD